MGYVMQGLNPSHMHPRRRVTVERERKWDRNVILLASCEWRVASSELRVREKECECEQGANEVASEWRV